MVIPLRPCEKQTFNLDAGRIICFYYEFDSCIMVNVYLFKDYFAKFSCFKLYGDYLTRLLLLLRPSIVAPLVKKYGKKEIASLGLLLAASATSTKCLIFSLDFSATAFVYVSAIGLFGSAFLNLVIWAFVTDVIDYHEYLTDLREDATVYSIYSMARKIGQALAGGLGGVAIAAVGYNSSTSNSNRSSVERYLWVRYFIASYSLYSRLVNPLVLISIK